MRINSISSNLYNDKNSINFSGNKIVSKAIEKASIPDFMKFYTKPMLENRKDVILKNLKDKLLDKVNELIKNLIANEAFTVAIDYSKNFEQLKFIDFVINDEFFHETERAGALKGIILASNVENGDKFISKIFSNEKLYKNDGLLSNLESILYTFYTKGAFKSRELVLDKVLSEEKLYNNQDFVNNLGRMLYQVDSESSSYKTSNILEGVLADEELSNDENYIKTVGEILALSDVARYTNPDFKTILKSMSNDRQINITKSIAAILGKEGSDIFVQIMKDKKLSNDENFLKYMPKIIYTITGKNVSWAKEIINYIQKNKFKNTEDFNKEMIFEYMYGDHDAISKIEKFVKVKLKAYEKKSQLENFLLPEKVNDNVIDKLFRENKEVIKTAIELLGEKNFLHAFYLKLNGLKDLCQTCFFIKEYTDEEAYQKLLLKINPSESKEYIKLQEKISELKSGYQEVVKSGDKKALKNLQNQINTLTTRSREILSNKLNYDPHTVINRIETIGRLLDSLNFREHNEIIDLMKDSNPENDLEWKTICCRRLFDKLNIEYDENLIERLDLTNSRYFGNLMVAYDGFYKNFQKMLLLIKKFPHRSSKEIFNSMSNNRITRTEFEKLGIDYDKWVDFDKNSFITIKTTTDDSKKLTVKKVDMNNIAKALFLGNEVSCCTRIGSGAKQETAPNYIMNKLIGAIEVLDSDIPIGNTMCYFAKVNDETALILDNIELLPEYRNNDIVRDAIFQYARKLCAEVGKPDIPVYVSGHRNKISLKDLKTEELPMLIIGNSGENNVYVDFTTSYLRIDSDIYKYKYYDAELTKIPN